MKRYFRHCKVVLIALAAATVAACAHQPETPQAPKKPAAHKLSSNQLQQKYIKTLSYDDVQAVQLGETLRLIIPSDHLFNPDSANLQGDYRSTLVNIAKLLKTYNKVNVQVVAYTDNHSDRKRKIALTTRQAEVVSSFLWKQGIDARLLYSEGYGYLNPVDSNNTAEGRINNRRIEISFQFHPETKSYE